MPQYCYQCPKCNEKKSEIRRIAQRNEPVACACGYLMRLDITAEGCWSDNTDYHTPVLSDSMGVHPNQVAKAQAMHPHIKYQADGRIRIDSPAEYRRVRKDLGFVDLRKR